MITYRKLMVKLPKISIRFRKVWKFYNELEKGLVYCEREEVSCKLLTVGSIGG